MELIESGFTYNQGRIAINNMFSGATPFNTLIVTGATTLGIVSASTINLNSIGAGTSVVNLGIDSLGNIVSGSSAPLTSSFQTITDAATIVWGYNLGSNAEVTLGGNRILSITGITDGASGILVIKQGGTGNNTITLPATSKVVNGGGGSILLSTTVGEEDILSFVYKGTTYYWNAGYNYN